MTSISLHRVLSLGLLAGAALLGGCGGSGRDPVMEWDEDERLEGAPQSGFDSTGALSSQEGPAIAVRVTGKMKYVGDVAFILNDAARVDRHHFAESTRDGRVKKLLMVQYESALAGAHLDHAEALSPEVISGYVFAHAFNVFSNHAAVAEGPGGEAVRTTAFLDGAGLWLDDSLAMSRFVTVNEDGNRALVIMYVEPAGEKAEQPGFEDAFRERALAAFALESR